MAISALPAFNLFETLSLLQRPLPIGIVPWRATAQLLACGGSRVPQSVPRPKVNPALDDSQPCRLSRCEAFFAVSRWHRDLLGEDGRARRWASRGHRRADDDPVNGCHLPFGDGFEPWPSREETGGGASGCLLA